MPRVTFYCLFCGFVALFAAPARADEREISFNRDIRPILTDNCFACHGPDEKQRQAELRLDQREAAVEAGAIAPGDADASSLVQRIFADDPAERMPPAESNKHLSDQQRELLKRWVAAGAEYEGHWAYIPPSRPAIPQGENAIDYLVKKRLAEVSLSPSPEADRRTLARRLHFDLVGLPPKPDEVAAFESDGDAGAYERLVERLLASPHYGERMALPWLDVVRFADTIGYHSDNPRNVQPYRDYVIKSFNENKPFDRFTLEQLAGDLLGGDREALVGSSFNHLLLTTEEGGAQPKDYEARMMADRVRAVGTVWLGQTFGCCQCHDHKFDPAKAKDFYSLGAFFADIREPIIGAREPGMPIPTPEQAEKLAALRESQRELEQKLAEETPDLIAARGQWESDVRASLNAWTALKPAAVTSDMQVTFKIGDDATVLTENNPASGVDTTRITAKAAMPAVTAIRIEALADPTFPANGPGRGSNGNFVLTEVRVTDAAGQPVAIKQAAATFEQQGFPAAGAIDGKTEQFNGWAVLPEVGKDQAIVFEFATPLAGDAPEKEFTVEMQQTFSANHTIGKFRLSATSAPLSAAGIGLLPPADIVEIIKTEPETRTSEQTAKLAERFRQDSPLLAEQRAALASAKKAADDFEASLPRCLVTVVADQPRVVRILPRGNWLDESGEIVEPAVPEYLAGSDPFNEKRNAEFGRLFGADRRDAPADKFAGDATRRRDRLDLARWIVSGNNPLTARVFVNRLWKQFFGVGLSKTLDDLGSQGEWPSHPELLDWLACEFRDSGWNVKHLVRLIVNSQTYRQASTASPELLARDPENRLLARQSRYRLEAELVRDNALAISGLLSPKIGGPSVKPYQPDDYWENLNFPPRKYEPSTGEDQYRRGIYTWWQRTFPHPSMIAFDAPSREECAADRPRSNIPQQALALLNDPTYVEAARALAARILKEGGESLDERVDWAWRQALQRAPSAEERSTIAAVVEKQRREFAADPAAAEAFLKVGYAPIPVDLDRAELAAWTNAARVILNLHESITRN
jgi:hypothetical protein